MDINIEKIDDITWKAVVTIDDITSEVNVSCATEEEAMGCVKEYHLPNMRRNDRRLKDLVFDWEIPQ